MIDFLCVCFIDNDWTMEVYIALHMYLFYEVILQLYIKERCTDVKGYDVVGKNNVACIQLIEIYI